MSNDDKQPAVNPPSGSDPGPASPFSRPEPGALPPQGPAQQPPPAASAAGPGQPTSQPYPGAAQPYPGPTPQGATPPPYPGSAQPYPNQPYAGQPYPGQPYGAQPNPGQAYPPPPGAMPGQPPTGVPPKRSNKTILLIGAGVVAVIIVIAVIVAMLPKAGFPGPAGSAPAPAKSGADAARGYLEALAAGDSAAALSYAEQVPADTSLLTDEVLAASNAVTPITDIQVVEPASDYAPISVSYLLGDETVSTQFYASNASGAWKLDSVTRDLSILDMNGIALTINGAPVQGSRVTLFPGSYSLVPTNNLYAVDGGAFVITSPQDLTSHTMQLGLSSTGEQKLRAAAQAQLKHCLKQTSLAPKGCGFSIRANGTGAVKAKWSISSGKNAMKNAKFRLDLAEPSRASAYTTVGLTVKGYNKSGSYVGRGVGTIFRANGNLSANPVSVTFQ